MQHGQAAVPESGRERRIVEETLAPEASMAVIARRHGVNATRYFTGASCIRLGEHEYREIVDLLNARGVDKNDGRQFSVEPPADVP